MKNARNTINIGQRLYNLRMARGLTLRGLQAEIEKHRGRRVSVSRLSEIERGEADNSSVRLLHHVAFALGLNIGELFVGTGYGEGTTRTERLIPHLSSRIECYRRFQEQTGDNWAGQCADELEVVKDMLDGRNEQ